MTEDNIINVCLCPGCSHLTHMKPLEDNVYFCRLCHQRFKQFKNGKLIYIPLAVAETMDDNKILFTFNSDRTAEAMKEMDARLKTIFKKYKDEEPEPDDELEFDIDFEPDFDPDEVN